MRTPWFASVAVMLVPCLAAAQPATTMRDLAAQLERGDRVIVEVAGASGPIGGRVVMLTPEGLTLRVEGQQPRTLAAADLRRVVRQGDSLDNGFRWGLAAGAALGCMAATVFVDGGTTSNCPIGALLLSPSVIGVAVLIDAAHDSSTEVFRAPALTSNWRPGAARARVGLTLSW